MISTRPFVSKIVAHENAIRRILMVLLAFLMTHIISYQKLPFTSSYQFPLIPFSIFVVYGILICETNTWNYRQLMGRYGNVFSIKNVRRIVQTNLLTCALIFTVLTVIQMWIFHFVMNPFRFAGLLAICLMISAIETGVFIVLELTRIKARKPLTLNRVATEKEALTILRNDELLTFEEDDVAYLIHQNGCIVLVNNQGIRFTTQFESLSEVEHRLSSQFFRANRQTLVSRKAVHSIKKDVNNKLTLQINHLKALLTVSRYKSKELKDWYKN